MSQQLNQQQELIIALMQRLHTCEAELALYKEKHQQSTRAYDQLLHAFKQIQRRQFGTNSERFLDKNPGQLDFLSEVPAQDIAEDKESDNTIEAANDNSKSTPKKRSKKTHGQFAKNLPRREVIIYADKPGDNSIVIRYEITELLHYVPPVYEVVVQKREVVVTQDKETNVSTLTIAPNPKRLLPKVGATESFLAHMIVSKLYDRQPLYHLEKLYHERFDFTCPRNKLARWFIESAGALQCLVNLLQDTILDYDVTFCDPTHLQVLDEPGRPPTQDSYVFTIKGGPPDKAAVVYTYNPDEHKAFLHNWFADYKGYLHVDGQNIFDVFEKQEFIQLLFCHSHARRKFAPIDRAGQKAGLATEAMRFYQKLYTIEREAKNKQLSATERYQLRQLKSKPLIDDFEQWITDKMPLTLPQSPLGKAMQYVHKRFAGLCRFLDDGRLELDTNSLEQKNKDLGLARNNFLFAQSVEGAEALCIHMSLIFTSLMHGHDPYHYYVHIMQQLPHCATVDDIEKLLPWNVVPQKQKRAQENSAAA
jgi:transposase